MLLCSKHKMKRSLSLFFLRHVVKMWTNVWCQNCAATRRAATTHRATIRATALKDFTAVSANWTSTTATVTSVSTAPRVSTLLTSITAPVRRVSAAANARRMWTSVPAHLAPTEANASTWSTATGASALWATQDLSARYVHFFFLSLETPHRLVSFHHYPFKYILFSHPNSIYIFVSF
jgi:hypothetical protein